ncbi:MAG: alpha/beta hydrolase [Lachnospiraceae bacterium]|nr:alpha/beta hydrolase [Lachnospiraceae bacterium]
MSTVAIILLILLLLLVILSFVFAYIITHGLRMTLDVSWNWQQENVPGTRRFKREQFTDYTVKGPKGEDIHVSFIPAREQSEKYVILAHGYTDTRFGMVKYLPQYYDLGFNCIMYDERGHGESTPEPCSYGIREVDFLLAVLKDSLSRYGENIKIGLHGESLGGAIVLISLKDPLVKEKVSFVVDDCGFADIITVLKIAMKQRFMPKWLVYPASFAATVMYGISFVKARPIDYVKGNRIPLLCMHGAQDDFIVPEHGKRVFEATGGIRELHLIEGAGHAQSAVVAPDKYGEILKDFLIKAGIEV